MQLAGTYDIVPGVLKGLIVKVRKVVDEYAIPGVAYALTVNHALA